MAIAKPALFVGRDAELARLATGLARVAIAVIYGVGGVGKSALARAFAATWAGPVVHVRIATGGSLAIACEDALRELARAGDGDGGGDDPRRALGEDALTAVIRAIDARGALWLVDDLHQLAPGERSLVVRELGRQLAKGRAIATSRELLPFETDGPDRLEVRLGGLDETNARALWVALDSLHGEVPQFASVWTRARGNPLLLRQAHACNPDLDDPVDTAVRGLAGEPRAIIGALALSELPLASAILHAIGGAAALSELATRLLVDPAGPHSWHVHDFVRERVVAMVSADERAALQARVAVLLAADRTLDPALRAREVARLYRALDRHADAAAYLLAEEAELIRSGATSELLRGLDAVPPELRSPEASLALLRARARALDLARAQRDAEALIARGGAPLGAILTLGQCALLRGELAIARHALEPLLARADVIGIVATMTKISLAIVETHLGSPDGHARLAAAERAAIDRDEAGMLVVMRGFLAWLDGRDDELAALLRPDEMFAGTVAALRANVVAPGVAALLCARLGLRGEAEQHYAAAAAALGRDEDLLNRSTLAFTRAHLDRERGDRLAALASFEAVAAVSRAKGSVIGGALCEEARGGLLLELGRAREGRAQLDAVAATCARVGIVSIARRIERARQRDPIAMLGEPTSVPAQAATPITRALAALRAAAAGSHVPAGAVDLDEPRAGFAVERALVAIAAALTARLAGDERACARELDRARARLAAEHADLDLVDRALEAIGRARAIASDGARRMLPAAAADALVAQARTAVDARTRELRIAGKAIALEGKPVIAKLLCALAAAGGEVVSKDTLALALWGGAFDPLVHDNPLKVAITRTRALLGDEISLRFEDFGYRLVVPPGFVYVDEPGV